MSPTTSHPGTGAKTPRGGPVAKYHSRPSAQYRYEHYDPEGTA